MNTIQYISGDATKPVKQGSAIIVHVCNDIGGWGAGFVLAISKRWREPEKQYRAWYKAGVADATPFVLGQVQFVEVGDDLTIANLIGQHGIKGKSNIPPIRYDAVAKGLERVKTKALQTGATVHMPRIGCGLAGGEWHKIEPLIIQHLTSQGVPVTVYDFAP